MTGGQSRLRSVDVLRAVAALLVVLAHTPFRPWPLESPLLAWLKPLADVGFSGVGLFLVVSGFSIHLRWGVREPGFSVREFWVRRWVRLYPTYYVALLAVAGVVALDAGAGALRRASTAAVVVRGNLSRPLMLLDLLVVVACNVVPPAYMGRAWSLALEEQIYAAYSLGRRLLHRIAPLRLLAAALVASLVWRVGAGLLHPVVPYTGSDWRDVLGYALPPARAAEWAAGFVLAEWYVGRLRLPPWVGSPWPGPLLLAAGIALREAGPAGFTVGGHRLYWSLLLLDTVLGAGFALVLAWFVQWERARAELPRPLVALAGLGAAAYSLYLVHPPLLRLVADRSGLPHVLAVVVGWVVAVAAGVAFYHAVERRFVRRASRVARARAVPVAAPAP